MPARKKTKARHAPELTSIRAVIFLGASSVSMLVAEVEADPKAKLRVVDVLSQPLDITRDVFRTNALSRETLHDCCRIIEGYQQLLNEYRQAGEVQVRLLGSNILLDVDNMDTVVNRLSIACGLRLEVMDDGEMTRLLYLHTQATLQKHSELQKKRVMVLHVGPGNTRLLLFDRGRITYYARYRMGAFRTAESIGPAELEAADNEASLIREHIRGVVEQMRHDYEETHTTKPSALLIFGPEFSRLTPPGMVPELLTTEQLVELTAQVAASSHSQRLEKYATDFASVKALLPGLVTYVSLAHEFEPDDILIPEEESRQGFLHSLLPSKDDLNLALEAEVMHFSHLLAGRYRVDKAHSQQVQKLCAQLFDQLEDLHQLTRHDRLLLNVGAILHEVGGFINPKRHHRHGQYIILNSELFGLSHTDVEIVGLLARYHRHGVPNTHDHSYAELGERDRLRVQKLAALLRVADAMERAHSRRISSFTTRFTKRKLELLIPDVRDLTLENLALRSKADLFTDIFGYEILLVGGTL